MGDKKVEHFDDGYTSKKMAVEEFGPRPCPF
jgi:hypothetical protein